MGYKLGERVWAARDFRYSVDTIVKGFGHIAWVEYKNNLPIYHLRFDGDLPPSTIGHPIETEEEHLKNVND